MKQLSLVAFTMALLLMTGCENTQRSLVFSTGTSWGIEIAVKPQTDSPINLLIGYKRAEILFDPIMEDSHLCGVTTSKHRTYTIKDQPHSVLAKLLGETKGSALIAVGREANASMSVAQWFASGKAAEILAASGGAAALTDNEGVANAIARAYLGQGLDDEEVGLLITLLTTMHDGLDALKDDSKGQSLARELSSLAPSFLTLSTQMLHIYDMALNSTTITDKGPPDINIPPTLTDVTAVWSELSGSVRSLRRAQIAKYAGKLSIESSPKITTSLTSENLDKVLEDSERELKRLESAVRSHPKVIEAVNYFLSKFKHS